jgi:hypothetical protein
MAEILDPKEIVSFKELLMSEIIQSEALMENPEQTSTLFRSMPAPHSAGSQHPIPEQASR